MHWLELHIDTNHAGLDPVTALLSSLGGSKGKDAAFTLLDGEEALLSGTVAFSPEAVSTLYELFEDCGGKDQPLEAVAERWSFEKEKAK